MDDFYFVPHLGLKQHPSPFKDAEGWDAANEGLDSLAAVCEGDQACSGFDSDLNPRDRSATRTVGKAFADASKGAYYKDEKEFEAACKSVQGSIAGKKCTGVTEESARKWVDSQNTLMDTLYGPVTTEEFTVGLDHGLRLGLVVAAVLLVLLKLTRIL